MKCLIVEGGAMRGIFPAGVLKAFADNKYDDFDLYIGVSAGACNLTSYLAGNHERNYGGYTKLMSQKIFFSWKRFLLGGHMMDLDWLWEKLNSDFPIDETKINTGVKKFYIVVTNIITGNPEYFLPSPNNIHDVLLASSGIPIVYKKFIRLADQNYTDGGVSDPIPIKFAIKNGATDILVLRTRPKDYLSKSSWLDGIWSFILRNRRKLRSTFREHDTVYNKTLELIKNPPNGIKINQICPDENMKTERTSQDVFNLNEDYQKGYSKGLEYLRGISRD